MPEGGAPGRLSTKALTVTLAGVGVAVVFISLLTAYYRRRRKNTTRKQEGAAGSSGVSSGVDSSQRDRVAESAAASTADGSVTAATRSHRSSEHQPVDTLSTMSGHSAVSTSTLTRADTATCSPAQLCTMGVEHLTRAINLWEQAQVRIHTEGPDQSQASFNQALDQSHTLNDVTTLSTQDSVSSASNTLMPSEEQSVVLREEEFDMGPFRDSTSFEGPMRELLERSQGLLSHYTSQVESQVVTDSALDALRELNKEYEETRERKMARSLTSDSSMDSFVSALEVPDLSDLEDEIEAAQERRKSKVRGRSRSSMGLYEEGLLALRTAEEEAEERNSLTGEADDQASLTSSRSVILLGSDGKPLGVRKLRTVMVGCSSDSEFLARVYGLRKAFDKLLSVRENRAWFIDAGTDLLSGVMTFDGKDPTQFRSEMESMMEFLDCEEGWDLATEELYGRGVKMMTFYDIVLDFVLMDAFDDLTSPPSSVTSITANRWISNSLKETALSTAVWSVMKAKRAMLKNQNGFLGHFYAVSENISPTLAWGFLGPDSPLKTLCYLFKDQVIEFITELFEPTTSYASVDSLGADIFTFARKRVETVKNASQTSQS